MANMTPSDYVPQSLLVQWHITDKCNLRCRHCYQSDYLDKGFDLKQLWHIAEQVFQLHDDWLKRGKAIPLRFTITGGEPFSHPDFLPLLDKLSQHPTQPGLAVLSNGSRIDYDTAQRLAQIKNLNFVQLSLDGNPKTHDAVRGKGNFDKVLAASSALNQAGVFFMWSFTAHSENYRQFGQVAKIAEKQKIPKIWSDRMIACNESSSLKPLNQTQTRQWIEMMAASRGRLDSKRDNKTHIAMNRALQFFYSCDEIYHCNAGNGLLTIMPDGEVYPCRRLPVSVGNLCRESLSDIYYRNPFLRRLRNFSGPAACRSCLYKSSCKGGLRCQAFAVTGDPFNADPGCWHVNNE